MATKKILSKNLSKTIALAVMAMGVLGYSSAASAEENDGFKTGQEVFSFTEPILGNAETDTAYIEGGVLRKDGIYRFDGDTTIDSAGANVEKGMYGSAGTAIIDASSINQHTILDLQGHNLTVKGSTATGLIDIMATGLVDKDTKVLNIGTVEINNPGKLVLESARTGNSGYPTPIYVNGGGKILIHNGEGNLESKTVVINSVVPSNDQFCGIKTMNGVKDGRSQVIIDGLVDIQTSAYRAAPGTSIEGISNVASTVSVGGGTIKMYNEDENGRKGNGLWAIRSYGEFTSSNPGYVYFNAIHEGVEGDATGSGKNKAVIEGGIGMSGSMNVIGSINVGFGTADSYFKGDVRSTGSYGAAQGNGAVNLWFTPGSYWEGNNISAGHNTNVYLDGATWTGNSTQNNGTTKAGAPIGFNLDIKNSSAWTVTGNSQVNKLSGTDGIIKPGEFTVTAKAAAEGTSVNVVGEAGELNDVANKIFYTNYVDGENNLSAKAVIEGKAARESAEMLFKEDNGQGYIDENKATDTEIFGEYNESIKKNTNVTVTEKGVWAPTGENSVPSLKGEAGSAINMSKAESLEISSYSGETTMLYGHEESNPTQIIGGDVNVGSAEEGSKINLTTDNKGINTLDKHEVEAVLNSMANKLTYEGAADGENNLTGKLEIAEGLTSSSASIKAADLVFDETGTGSLKPGSVDYGAEETAVMKSVKGALVGGVLMTRAESNDLLKRMGDIRLAEQAHGLWAKYYGGKYEMDSANAHVSYKAYQLGYDTKAGKNWTIGGAVSYNEGKSSKTELKNTAVGIYGTWQEEKGQYVDLIAKVGWLKNDLDVTAAGYKIADTLKTSGMSMSAEYGKRFTNKAGFFLDPSAELTFSHMNGKKLNAKVEGSSSTLGIDQDAFNSLVGRLGMRIGQKTAKSSVYAKVALAHEFSGDFDVTFSAPGEPTKTSKTEFKDTWGEFQIGGTTKIGKAGMLYANYQRSFAGDVKEKYRVDAGLRWSF